MSQQDCGNSIHNKSYNEDNLKSQPAAISNEPAPIDVLKANWVDKCCEEASTAAKELKYGNAPGSLRKREQLDQKSYSIRLACINCSSPNNLLYVKAL